VNSSLAVGVVPFNSGPFIAPGALGAMAAELESLGYESMWTFEHVIVPHTYESRYPYSPTGKLAVSSQAEFVDPLIAIAWAAAATTTIRFGTGVNILSQVNPLYLAKQASSIDHLSGGRLMLGLGVGWLEEEFDALNVPFGERGARADEYIDAMTAAWSGETVDFQGRFLNWHDWQMLPAPTQRPRVPIIVGGTSKPAIRRVVARGDGWYVIHRDLDHFAELMASLRAECERQGRDVDELELTAYWNHHREGLEGAKVYAEAGVKRILVNLMALRMGDHLDAARRFAADVLPHVP
jgi:probable F420-dependent oxidoreductase